MHVLTSARLENPRIEPFGTRYDLKLSYCDECRDKIDKVEYCCDIFISDTPTVSASTSCDGICLINFGYGDIPCKFKSKIIKKIREMTLSEIEKELGYPVKIVEE